MSDEITDAILESATKPAEASGDGHSVKQHPLPDLIEADKYVRAKEAQAAGGLGIRFLRIQPGAS